MTLMLWKQAVFEAVEKTLGRKLTPDECKLIALALDVFVKTTK
jgi:hypothetical protein